MRGDSNSWTQLDVSAQSEQIQMAAARRGGGAAGGTTRSAAGRCPVVLNGSAPRQASTMLPGPLARCACAVVTMSLDCGSVMEGPEGSCISVGRSTPAPIPVAVSASSPARASAGAVVAVAVPWGFDWVNGEHRCCRHSQDEQGAGGCNGAMAHDPAGGCGPGAAEGWRPVSCVVFPVAARHCRGWEEARWRRRRC